MFVPLIKEASIVRNALREYYGETAGLCYEASSILGHLLNKHGLRTNLVCGYIANRGVFKAHYWLDFDNKLLDITGDQFNYLGFNIPEILYDTYDRWPQYGVRYRQELPPILNKVGIKLLKIGEPDDST